MTVGGRLRRALATLLRDQDAGEAKALRRARAAARVEERAARQDRRRRDLASLSTSGEATLRLDYTRHEIRLLASSTMEREWRAQSCAKEPWTVAWIEESMRTGGVLYDIGANTGAFSLIAAKVAGAHGTVVAFEPGYASFAHLCDNIVLNGCQDAIVPVSLALGSVTGLGTFAYRTLHPGQSRHDFTERPWSRRTSTKSGRYHQPILSMTLDRAVELFTLPLPSCLKLDVDGGEANVLRGAAMTLASPQLRTILIEIDDALTDEVTSLLAGSGFVLEQKHKRVHTEQTQVWYGVFTRRPVNGHPTEP